MNKLTPTQIQELGDTGDWHIAWHRLIKKWVRVENNDHSFMNYYHLDGNKRRSTLVGNLTNYTVIRNLQREKRLYY